MKVAGIFAARGRSLATQAPSIAGRHRLRSSCIADEPGWSSLLEWIFAGRLAAESI
jgi:hypothetical protein